MTCCPACGHTWTPAAPPAHRGELERQLGDVDKAALLRHKADVQFGRYEPFRLDSDFIAWRGYVWAKVRTRKATVCEATGVNIVAGAWAWRQLSEVKDRNLRVSEYAWRDL